MSKAIAVTKEEIHEVLQLATKIKVAFAASDISDSAHKILAAAYADLQDIKKTTTVAFGVFLREFANKHAPVVAAEVDAPAPKPVKEEVKEEAPAPKKGKKTAEVEEPVVEEPAKEKPVEVVEAPAE